MSFSAFRRVCWLAIPVLWATGFALGLVIAHCVGIGIRPAPAGLLALLYPPPNRPTPAAKFDLPPVPV